jgi:hypothetical protein
MPTDNQQDDIAELKIKQPGLSHQEALALLTEGEITEMFGYFAWGSNYTFLVRVSNGDLSAYAVYKPIKGERTLWDFARGTLALRERAAFLIDETLGWNLIPATVLTNGPLGLGSVQYYVEHDPEENYFTFGDEYTQQIRQIVLLDLIINNADRKGGHCLLDENGKLWAIDHGICFHTEPKLRTVIWNFAGQAVPEELIDAIKGLETKLGDRQGLRKQLDKLLCEEEIEALVERVTETGRLKRFPYPGPDHILPWPPI